MRTSIYKEECREYILYFFCIYWFMVICNQNRWLSILSRYSIHLRCTYRHVTRTKHINSDTSEPIWTLVLRQIYIDSSMETRRALALFCCWINTSKCLIQISQELIFHVADDIEIPFMQQCG